MIVDVNGLLLLYGVEDGCKNICPPVSLVFNNYSLAINSHDASS
jgi:hypothetical protein